MPKTPKGSYCRTPKEQMIEVFALWKTASELRLISEDREYDNERPDSPTMSKKRSDRKAKRRDNFDEEKRQKREFTKYVEKLNKMEKARPA